LEEGGERLAHPQLLVRTVADAVTSMFEIADCSEVAFSQKLEPLRVKKVSWGQLAGYEKTNKYGS